VIPSGDKKGKRIFSEDSLLKKIGSVIPSGDKKAEVQDESDDTDE
jgi:hypothetical protein